jgi:hypothetical protein
MVFFYYIDYDIIKLELNNFGTLGDNNEEYSLSY